MEPLTIDASAATRAPGKQIIRLTDPEAIAIICGWFNGPLETEQYKIVYDVEREFHESHELHKFN